MWGKHFVQVLSETQTNGTNTATVSYAYDTAANGSRLTTYPNGRVLNYTYTSGLDADISRLSSITSTTGTNSAVMMESYSYLGDATPLVITRGNGITGTTSLDQFGHVGDLNWTNTNSASVDRFSYTYDANDNVLSKKNGVVSSLSELYAYDNLDRLTTFSRGTLNSTNDGITTASTLAGNARTWTLDALGNQSATSTDGTATTRGSNHQNELTQVGANTLAYDANGNQTLDENGHKLIYDAWNRLVQVQTSASDSTPLVTYGYDALGRRIGETESGATTNLYYSIGWQVLEERQGGTVTAQNVWSATYIDAMIARDVTVSGATTRYWFQHDANFNTTSVTDNSGSVVERYVYDPYGSVTILNADGSLKTSGSLAGQTRYLSQGRRFDPVVGTYDSRRRVYDPVTGTWKQQDPFGAAYVDGTNLYQNERSGPTYTLDPFGLAGESKVTISLSLSLGEQGIEGARLSAGYGYGVDSGTFGGSAIDGGLSIRIGNFQGNAGSGWNIAPYISATGTIGCGQDDPMSTRLYNYYTMSAIPNHHRYSLSFGQTYYFDSAVPTFTRVGSIGLRAGAFELSLANDAGGFPFFGGGTDEADTGYGAIDVRLGDGGTFTFAHSMYTGTVNLPPKYVGNFGRNQFNLDNTYPPGNPLYPQTPYQQWLNMARTVARYTAPCGLFYELGYRGSPGVQDIIHQDMLTPKSHLFYRDPNNFRLDFITGYSSPPK